MGLWIGYRTELWKMALLSRVGGWVAAGLVRSMYCTLVIFRRFGRECYSLPGSLGACQSHLTALKTLTQSRRRGYLHSGVFAPKYSPRGYES